MFTSRIVFIDTRERAKAVHLQFEDEVVIVEGLRQMLEYRWRKKW